MTCCSDIDDAATWEQAEMAEVMAATGATAAGEEWVWGSSFMLTHA